MGTMIPLDEHFWEAVCIAIFVALFFKPIKNLILQQLESYQNHVADEVHNAEEMRKNADTTLEHYRKLHTEFTEKSDLIMKTSQENIQRLTYEAKEKLRHNIKVQRELHNERVYLYELETLNKLRKDAMQKALGIARNFLEEHVSSTKDTDIKSSLHTVRSNKQLFH